jgi:hypothetical protein
MKTNKTRSIRSIFIEVTSLDLTAGMILAGCSVLRGYPMDLIGHLAVRHKWEAVQGDYDTAFPN